MTLKVYKYGGWAALYTFDEISDDEHPMGSYEITETDLNEAVFEVQTKEGLAELLWKRAKFKEDIAELRGRFGT